MVEDKGINPGVGYPCSRRQAPSKVDGEDMSFIHLCIPNLQVDDFLSQRTPLTIDGWRPGRDDKLWSKYSRKAKDQERQMWVWEWERESWIEEGEADLDGL